MQVVHKLLKSENSSRIILDGFPSSIFSQTFVDEFGRNDEVDVNKFVMVAFSVMRQKNGNHIFNFQKSKKKRKKKKELEKN